jgi:primosomal protein N' (replication factor Y)
MNQREGQAKNKRFAEVAVSLPVWKTFSYGVPVACEAQVVLGKRVLVPFKKRKVTGYVLSFPTAPPDGLEPEKVKEVIDVLDEFPLFDEAMLSFFRWISTYYVHPLGEVIKTGLPPGMTVESCRMLKITPQGRARIAEFPPESMDHQLLEMCANEEEISLTLLSRRLKAENLHSRIFSLKRSGLLVEELRLRKGRIKAKLETFAVSGRENDAPHRRDLTPKESEILGFIESRKCVSRREIQTEFPRASAYLRRLAQKGCITLTLGEVYRDPFEGEVFGADVAFTLTPDQEKALSEIERAITTGAFHPYLLHGVTGSGKTEVYLQAIRRVIEQGRGAIVLVPEISLTPQLISRFKTRFKEGVTLLHSALSPGERYDQWRQILRGEACIAIGARSAIFAPFKRPGIIIVDEEHETSFKQEEKLKYNARDLAVMRAKMADAVLLLGSATPSIESFFHTQQTRKFHYLGLPHRVESRLLPTVEVIDLRSEKENGKHPVFSIKLKDALLHNAESGAQSLLFLNRRGFANFILCRDCGWTFDCPNCSVTLTYHAVGRALHCHHCGLTTSTPVECPRCRGFALHPLGLGTQKVEEEILKLMPAIRIARMDRDTTTRKGSYGRIVRAMESGSIDILIGTQMIVKGHDFPNITLVGIICADTILNFPDFRAAERTFQLLTQAAGRAGRGSHPGRVIIQTYNPDHYSVQKSKNHDFLGFYHVEIQHREELGFPPFSRLVNFRVSGNSERITTEFARRLGIAGRQIKNKRKIYRDHLDLLGPCSAPLAKIKGKHRWQLLVKGDRSERLHRFIAELVKEMEKQTTGVHLEVDVDPLGMM